MWVLGWVLLLIPLGLLAVLLAWSWPGTARPFRDINGQTVPGSIAEKIRVEVNGLPQGMFIKGRDATKPVLLVLHGGLPSHVLTQRYPTHLEDDFVVCWWDQRGAGLSYSRQATARPITLEQLIDDTLAVTSYLRRRFGRDRIYLIGHSGGAFLGMHVVARAPALYHAFVGVAQMADQRRSELEAYQFMLERFRERRDATMIRRLEAAPVTEADGVPSAYLAVRDTAMHRLGVGTTRGMKSVITGLFLASLQHREYTVREKISLWRGKIESGVHRLWRDMLATDLARAVPDVALPVYFFHGVHDRTCSYAGAKRYFSALRAPLKGFYTFHESAHSPIFEEPARAREIIQLDVLAGQNRLADKR